MHNKFIFDWTFLKGLQAFKNWYFKFANFFLKNCELTFSLILHRHDFGKRDNTQEIVI